MDFVDIDSVREAFAIRSFQLRMELEAILERTRILEEAMRQQLPDDNDIYQPCEESKEAEPARKKMKM